LRQAGIGEGAPICNAYLSRDSDAPAQFHGGSGPAFSAKGHVIPGVAQRRSGISRFPGCNCTPGVWSFGPSRN